MIARRLLALLALLAVVTGVWSSHAEPRARDSESFGPKLLHLPVLERTVEQGILTPVPIGVELPPDLAPRAKRVLVHYRVWGDPDWTVLELRRVARRWSGAIPCLEVSTITGDVKYYIRVHDAAGRVLANAGSRVKPFRVTIKHDTLLGRRASKQGRCPDPSDCPRGLLGCPSEEVEEIPCQSDTDCEGGSTCSWRGVCERSVRHHNWLSLSVEQDVGLIATSNACSVPSQENEGYACFRQTDGANYVGNPVATNEPLRLGWAPTRIVLGLDRVIFYGSSIGVRAGYAFVGEGPTLRGGNAFVPWSLAVRATHWFGDDPFAHTGLRPFVLVTAGYGMFDVETSARVREDPTQPALQGGNDLEQTLDVYKRAGDGFVGVGGGLAFALTHGIAIAAELSVLEVFPFRATVFAASAGPMLGF